MVQTNQKLQFGLNAIQGGQKSTTINAEPRLVANSTQGKFTVTSPVSKALGVAVGENIMFLNNIATIEAAIAQNNEDLVAYAEENGIDLTTQAGIDQVVADFTMWAIAKGTLKYDSKGNPIMAAERYSKEDKLAFLKANAKSYVEANREALIERVGNPDATDEELIKAINEEDVENVESPKYHAAEGSKTMTTSNATGVGAQLNFTDTAIWTALKADLEDKTSKNRVFDVDLKNPINYQIHNGKELVDVVAYPINFVEDTDPIVRTK